MKTYSDYGIDVPAGASGEHRTTCPVCSKERHKSWEKCLSVNTEKGTWLCHHCAHAGGLGKANDESEPVYREVKHVHCDLTEKMLKYFSDRGISKEVLIANGVCSGRMYDHEKKSYREAVKFPYFKNGICVNAKYKTPDKKFSQEKGGEPCLYRFDAISVIDVPEIVICEGELDALACHEAGIINATSVPNGAPAISARNYEKEFAYLESAEGIFTKCKRVVIAVDNDIAGKKLEAELARRIGVEKCYRVQWPNGCKDANDVLMKHGKMKLGECIDKAQPYPVDGIFCSTDVKDLVLNLYDVGDERGLSTGWPIFDNHYTVKPGQMTVVTGIPSHGKSNFIDSLVINLVKQNGWRVAVFSPENWPIQRHVQSYVEKLTQKCFSKWSKNRLSRPEVEVNLEAIQDYIKFIVPDEKLITPDVILEMARVIIYRYGARGIIMDPWNEMDHIYNGETETQYISATLSRVRRFARKHDVHIWFIAHPHKLVKDKETQQYAPPTMYEISGGAHWRNKADMGLCVYRPDITKTDTEVHVQKVRFRECGRVGVVRFVYNEETNQYEEIGSGTMKMQ